MPPAPARLAPLATLALLALGGRGARPPAVPERALAHDNRVAAGVLRAGVLALRLELREVRWDAGADGGPSEVVQAFAEEGKPATIPGPLIRVPAGTRVRASVRNTLARDTLLVFGLHARPAPAGDTLRVPPGAAREVAFVAGTPGTYFYWGTTTRAGLEERLGADSQLSGALVVDPPGSAADDRVFVLGAWHVDRDTTGPKPWVDRDVMVINGRMWPRTERFAFTVGDSVRWRWVNPSADAHPMHLHGFYYDVTSRGDWAADTAYARGDRRRVVTELVMPGGTMTMAWRAERAGNWLFHCHFAFHVSHFLSFSAVPDAPDPGAPDAADHSVHGMAGLVLALQVRERAGALGAAGAARDSSAAPARAIRLVAAALPDDSSGERYAYVVDGGAPAAARGAAPALVLRRGEPVRITVVNGLRAPTAVHWHGIELQRSYADGVPGWSGAGAHLAPAIAPADSFVAEFTPPRAGTFIFHSHANEGHQIGAGLADALVVTDDGRVPARDLTFVLGGDDDRGAINHARRPAPVELTAGVTYRLRLVNIDTDRRMIFALRAGDSLLAWRALAKDGADLPPRQATVRPATLLTGPGETADFAFTPTRAGALRLEAVTQLDPGWRVEVPIRVRPAR